MLRDFLRLFIPHICPLCGSSMLRHETVMCFACKTELPETNFHLYPHDNSLAQTFWGRTELEFAVACYFYTKGLKVQNLVHMLKYKDRKDVGEEIGRYYGQILKGNCILNDVTCIIPVPLHKKKKRIRGYNQAEVFANGLSESLGIPVDTTSLQRIAFTETQTKKSRFARWKNVKEMFHLSHPENIHGKHVVIVDDVITTGATLESCIIELKKAGNVKVSVIAIALASG
jgi:ComF family protein